MDLLHLYPFRRNAPLRRLKVDFRPFRTDQLVSPDEHQRRESGMGDEKAPLICVDFAEKFSHGDGFGDGRMMPVGSERESAA